MTAFLQAWRTSNWAVMYRMLSAEDRARVREADFRTLLVDFRRLAGVVDMAWTLGEPQRVVLPPAPRPPDLPPPTPSPVPTVDPSADPTPSGTPVPTPPGTPAPPDTPLDGPRLGLQAALAPGCQHRALRRRRAGSRPVPGCLRRTAGRSAGSRRCCSRSSATAGGSGCAARSRCAAASSPRTGRCSRAPARMAPASIRRSGWPARPSAMPPRPPPTRSVRASAPACGAATWSAAADWSRAPMPCWPARPASSCRRFRPRANRWRCSAATWSRGPTSPPPSGPASRPPPMRSSPATTRPARR